MNLAVKSVVFLAVFAWILLADTSMDYQEWIPRSSRGMTLLEIGFQTGQGHQYCHRERSAAIHEIASSLDILGTRNDKEEPVEGDSIIIDSCGADPIRNKISNGVDPWFSSDKFMHFGVSAAIPGLTYYMYVFRLNQDETQGKIISVSLTGLIGLGKEIYDKKTKGHFSWKDLVWDGLGIAAGYFIFIHKY